MNHCAVGIKEGATRFPAKQLLERARVFGVGACFASLMVCAFPFCSPAMEPSSSTPLVLSQKIEVNPSPPIEQNPSPPIEQNPSPPIEQNPTPPIESDPKPPIEENPSPPTEEQSMCPAAGAGKTWVSHQRGDQQSNIAVVFG